MASLLSTPTTSRAGGTSANDALPPPHPTSSTDPPSGTRSIARARDGESVACGSAWNSSTGKPHGGSGAAARIGSGIAHAASSSRHLSAALLTAPSCPTQPVDGPYPRYERDRLGRVFDGLPDITAEDDHVRTRGRRDAQAGEGWRRR